MATPNNNREIAMSPILNSPPRSLQRQGSAASNRGIVGNEMASDFDLRDTLAATVVRELSFAEFRAAMMKTAKRNN
jgi:hypothetical protein